MELLLTIHQNEFEVTQTETNNSDYRTREAARAVLLSDSGQIFLMNVRLHGYLKLPGGGIDEGESVEEALARELMEEVGCKAELVSEVGKIVEYRDYEKLKQTSYCFIAKQVDEQRESSLEESELLEGMIETKAGNIEEAIDLLANDKPDNLEGKFIQRRDLAFLEKAKELISHST
jgi:8-oxo-dGTP pyrophosphatase MutT (NUDIX family)